MVQGRNPFKLRTLSKRAELFGEDHKKALEELEALILEGEPVVLLGPRRVGKTSLLNIALNENKNKICYLYYDLSPFMGQRAINVSQLVVTKSNLRAFSEKAGFRVNLKIIEGWRERVTTSEYSRELLNLLRELHERCDCGAIIFDEAQTLAFLRGIDFRGVFQLIMNSYDNISLVLTGSMPGILSNYLNPEAEEAGFSRFFNEVSVNRWDFKTTEEYLRRHINIEESEVREVSLSLSNVPGFVAMYGHLRWRGLSHSEALSRVYEKAVSLWKSDVRKFLTVYSSHTYYYLLLALAIGPPIGLRYSELMESTFEVAQKMGGSFSESSFKRALRRLRDAGFIKEIETGRYLIPEPPLREALRRLRL